MYLPKNKHTRQLRNVFKLLNINKEHLSHQTNFSGSMLQMHRKITKYNSIWYLGAELQQERVSPFFMWCITTPS
uniref:Uncharacterized protein n=1 Tax=Rhizophora mucronata TaxID=61149 RepID=A0A2P2L2A6_RHIMU